MTYVPFPEEISVIHSIQSTSNNSTTPLAGAGTFTGTGEQNSFPSVGVTCKTDADGTIYFDFSPDGTNWDSTFPVNGFAVSAGVNEFHTAEKLGRYHRTRFVNGSSAQSYLRLYTYYGAFNQGNLPIGATISADADARVVRSVSSELDLAFGRFSGLEENTKFGMVLGIDAADNAVDIWDFASDALSTRTDTKTFPTSAATLYAASDSAADTSKQFTASVILSDGTRSDVTWTTDATDGRTAVSLGVSGLDVNTVTLSGSSQTHAGNIYVQQGSGFTAGVPNTPANVLAFVRAGYGRTQQATYTVPAGYQIRIKRVILTIARASGAAGSAQIEFRVKPAGKSWIVMREWHLPTGFVEKHVAGLVYDAGTQIVMRLEDVSDSDTNVTGEFHYELAAI